MNRLPQLPVVSGAAVLLGLVGLLGCPAGATFEPGPPQIGVVGFGIPEGAIVSVSVALDGGAPAPFDVAQNGVSVVVAEDVSEGAAWVVALEASPADVACAFAGASSGTMGTRNVYVDLVCTLSGERCNGLDDDGDGEVDEGLDGDNDGATPCGADGLPGTADDDCDDGDASVGPGVAEVCNDGVDQDCDPETPDLADADADGLDCTVDCDDADDTRGAAEPERCNGVDDDCDGAPAAGELDDQDGDGLADACDPWPELGCASFTVEQVTLAASDLPGAWCFAFTPMEELPPMLTDALGVVEFSGVFMDWDGGVFELAGAGLASDGESWLAFAGVGCVDDLGKGVECDALGRAEMTADPVISEEQYAACAPVAAAGCGGPPLVLSGAEF